MGIPIPMLFTNRFAQHPPRHMRHSEEPTKIKATPTNREYHISEPLRWGQWGNTGCFAMRWRWFWENCIITVHTYYVFIDTNLKVRPFGIISPASHHLWRVQMRSLSFPTMTMTIEKGIRFFWIIKTIRLLKSVANMFCIWLLWFWLFVVRLVCYRLLHLFFVRRPCHSILSTGFNPSEKYKMQFSQRVQENSTMFHTMHQLDYHAVGNFMVTLKFTTQLSTSTMWTRSHIGELQRTVRTVSRDIASTRSGWEHTDPNACKKECRNTCQKDSCHRMSKIQTRSQRDCHNRCQI